MKHPYPIREIAAQAGLSQATVDRVLHHRGGVRESTVRDVHQAIAALDRRHANSPLPARTFTVDLIVHDRSRAGAALRAELPTLRPAVIRPRLRPATDPLTELTKVARSHSDGLILEAPESPEVIEAVGRLSIPVVTLNTDLPTSKRVAHVGPDHAEAGATAAYLLDQWLAARAGDVLVVVRPPACPAAGDAGPGPDAALEWAARSPGARPPTPAAGRARPSRGPTGPAEAATADRVAGFRTELSSRSPNRRLLATDPARLAGELAANPAIRAVYTPEAGHNSAVIAQFAAGQRNCDAFVAHGLDDENAALLRAGHLSAVLHHDLRSDLRAACLTILQALGAVPGPIRSASSSVRIITPLNLPPA
ncbi:LacI family DNA-binding transcriptional regulator [Actinoplanes sp. Pm04-4]|uniref:LacI family DNA-binding transcriptional regulator n=1 Tax=Paractinoplanes pyxinae TaxID=2997416 RepID=A0ABT4ATR2_9ACTN|nr:LacI family DNA-binding transcriptional regulator [Actinoplanes pyxinae]MCY1137628.1 LacI family DNA-binding transcriptional regulator [Actinoplanes pyxinae]